MFQALAVFLSMARKKPPYIFPAAYFTKIRFNIIKLSIHRLSQWILSMRAVQPETGKNICFYCVLHKFCLSWISSPLWNVWGSTYHGTFHAVFFWSVVISSFLGPNIFLSIDFALTSKMSHGCTNNSICSWWFSFPFTHKIVLLCWFCTRDVSPDKLSH
jgi:hypothetical protein